MTTRVLEYYLCSGYLGDCQAFSWILKITIPNHNFPLVTDEKMGLMKLSHRPKTTGQISTYLKTHILSLCDIALLHEQTLLESKHKIFVNCWFGKNLTALVITITWNQDEVEISIYQDECFLSKIRKMTTIKYFRFSCACRMCFGNTSQDPLNVHDFWYITPSPEVLILIKWFKILMKLNRYKIFLQQKCI